MKKISVAGKIKKLNTSSIVSFLFVMLYSLGCLVPFYWAVINSFKTNDEILVQPFSLPRVWKVMNYIDAWFGASMSTYFINTALYTVVATGTLLLIVSMASYIIARVKTSLALYTYFTLGLMIPIQAIILPIFITMRDLGLSNTRISIILVYIALNISISTFILVGFMRSLPKELEEAAKIDGCSRYGTFFRIMLPLSAPGLATIGILAFLGNWNDYLVPLILLTDSKLKVISLGVQELRGMYSQDYGLITAGIVISFLPVVVIYIAFQEKVIAGMTAGAVKG